MAQHPALRSNQRLVERADPRTGATRVYLLTRLPRLTGRTKAMRAALFDARADDSNDVKDAIYYGVFVDRYPRSPERFRNPLYVDEFADPFYEDEESVRRLAFPLWDRLMEVEAQYYIWNWHE
jgi:hypothetical protein